MHAATCAHHARTKSHATRTLRAHYARIARALNSDLARVNRPRAPCARVARALKKLQNRYARTNPPRAPYARTARALKKVRKFGARARTNPHSRTLRAHYARTTRALRAHYFRHHARIARALGAHCVHVMHALRSCTFVIRCSSMYDDQCSMTLFSRQQPALIFMNNFLRL